MVSHAVARLFTRSLYDYALRAKQLPVLKCTVPYKNRQIRVNAILREHVGLYQFEVVDSVCRIDRLYEVM
jgi:hypothetical protein